MTVPEAEGHADLARIAGVVLAAGTSSRMGRPKQVLPLAGRPVLQHVVAAVASSCLTEIVLVLGDNADEVRAAIRLSDAKPSCVVVNPDYAKGQSTSLRLGLRSVSARVGAAAILLGDQPFITAALIDRVAAAFAQGNRPAARPVYRDAGGRSVPGHPVFLARSIWSEVDGLRGDEGARKLFAAHPEWLLAVPVDGRPPPDIDTPAEYARAVDGAGDR